MPSLTQAVRSALKDCLNLQRNEKILILGDRPCTQLAQQFYQEAASIARNSHLFILPHIIQNGFEPSRHIAAFMQQTDVIVMITSRSLSHTKARRRASALGARIASLPGVIPEVLMRTLTGNYKGIINRSRKLADILTIGRSAHLQTPSGTNLTFSLSRMRGYPDTGMIHEAGQFSNLPAGEGSASPVSGSAEGTLIIDGSFSMIGRVRTPVKMLVKNGYVARISGGEEAERIRKLIRPFGREGRNVAEVGIGTNPRAKLTGCTVEDEKVLGTLHVALGNNISFGGKCSVGCHFDGILLKPTFVIDGKTILEEGILQV